MNPEATGGTIALLVTVCRLMQDDSAPEPIEASVDGSVMVSSDSQPENAELFMVVTPSLSVIVLSALQFKNACWPIVFSPSLKVISLRLVHPWNT